MVFHRLRDLTGAPALSPSPPITLALTDNPAKLTSGVLYRVRPIPSPRPFVLAVLLAEKALPPHPSYHTGLISHFLIETLPHSTPLSQPPSLLSLSALFFFFFVLNTFCETLSSTQGMNESTTNESVIHSFNHSIPSFLP